MSKRSHDKQVRRDRARRRASTMERKRTRTKVVVLVMAVLMVLSLFGAALGGILTADDTAPPPPPDEPDPAPRAEPCPPDDAAPEVDSRIYDEPPLADLDPDAIYRVTLETTCGDVTIELDTAGAPLAAANLVGLAEDGYYDGVEFHRVVEGFVVQVGDPAGTGCGQDDCSAEGFDPDAPTYPGYTFEDELDTARELFAEVQAEFAVLLEEAGTEDVDLDQVPGGYPRGTVAMANRGSDTNGSQFFVAQGEQVVLEEPAFTVLGQVVDGMDVVDRIAGQAVDQLGRPLDAVRIVSVQVAQR